MRLILLIDKIKKNPPCRLDAKIKGVLATHTVAMVTFFCHENNNGRDRESRVSGAYFELAEALQASARRGVERFLSLFVASSNEEWS